MLIFTVKFMPELFQSEYITFAGQPIAERDQTGAWTDYIFANGKKIAIAPLQENVLQVAGSYSGNWTGVGLSIAAPALQSYTFQAGDVLNVRQRKYGYNVHGGILIYGKDSYGNTIGSFFNDQDGQRADDDTLGSGTWHNRRIPLDGLAGTIYSGISFGGGTSTDYNFQFGSITVSSADGTVRTIYNGGTNGSYTSVASDGNATRFYVADHLGSAQMEFSAAGLPLATTQFAPFGAEISPATSINHYKFTGKERDAESGLDYFGARYMSSNMGRFMSPDSGIDQHPEDPQSWNLYTYGRNNPLVLVDPSGEYVCGSNVSSQQCDNFQKGLDEAQKGANALKDKYGADSSQYKNAQGAIDAYGKQNVDNGVTIMAGKAGSDSLTQVANTAGPQTADNPNGQKITVTLGTDKLNGAEGNGLDIGHEGSHVADGNAWVNSGFSPSMNPTRYGSEFRAFQVERNLAEGINWGPLGFPERSGPVYIWKPGWTGSQVDAGINNELRQHYNLSPSSKILAFKQNTQGGH